MSRGNDRPPTSVGSRTLPARFFTDPGWFQQELESIHLGMWLYAGRSESIARPGDFFL